MCVPTGRIFARPEGMSAEEGAAIPVNYLTAWQLIVVMGGLKAGETMLVHSAGGGVGVAATQIAKHLGAKVIGTASAAKHPELRALGVDHLIDYRTEDFEKRAREITQGRGVERILDPIGGELLKKGYRLLAPTGRLGIFGASSAARSKTGGMLGMASMLAGTPWLQFNPLSLMSANKGVFGVNLGHLWERRRSHRGLDEFSSSSCEKGSSIKPRIARTFSFRRGRGRTLFYPGPQQHRKSAAYPLVRTSVGLTPFKEPRMSNLPSRPRWKWARAVASSDRQCATLR